jgi:hypothetical protein
MNLYVFAEILLNGVLFCETTGTNARFKLRRHNVVTPLVCMLTRHAVNRTGQFLNYESL